MSKSRCRKIAIPIVTGSATPASARAASTTAALSSSAKCPTQTRMSAAGRLVAPHTSHSSCSRTSPEDLRNRARTATTLPKNSSTVSSKPTLPRTSETVVGSHRSGGSAPWCVAWKPSTSPTDPTRNAATPAKPTSIQRRQPGERLCPSGSKYAMRTSQTNRRTQLPAPSWSTAIPARLVLSPVLESNAPKQTPCATSSQPIRGWDARSSTRNPMSTAMAAALKATTEVMRQV